MKKKIIVTCSFLYLLFSCHGANSRISRSNIWRARNLVKGAPLYYEQTLPFLTQYLRGIGMFQQANAINQAIAEIKNQENLVEAELQSRLTDTEKAALTKDRSNLELYQILMNAQVPDDINLVFFTLSNIASNVEKDIRDYRKSMVKIAPRKLEIDRKIVRLQKQLDNLKAEKEKLLAQVKPELSEYYEKMKRGGASLFNKTKNIGSQIKQKASKQFEQVDGLQKKMETLKKERVSPLRLKQLADAKKAKQKLFKDIVDEASKLGQAETIRLASILDLLSHIELTTNVILRGPEEINRWNLDEDIFKIKKLNDKTSKQKKLDLPKLFTKTD